MSRLNELRPIKELTDLYAGVLLKYKTPAAKKACMTRDIKAHEQFIKNVEEAVNGSGWLHGERFFGWHLAHYQRELAAMINIRNTISHS